MRFSIGVLDGLRVPSGIGAGAVLAEAISDAAYAEHLGYVRYWFTEHHEKPYSIIATSAPEMLISEVALRTQSMRIGVAGILLQHYSPLKIAEVFHTLSLLYPGRVDLGIARAPGGAPEAIHELREGREPEDSFVQRVERLLAHVEERTMDIEVWPLGNGTVSGQIAAAFGLPFAFGDPEADARVLQDYKRAFRPSRLLDAPRGLLSVRVACASTDAEAVESFERYRNQILPQPTATKTGTSSVFERFPAAKKGSTGSNHYFPALVIGSPSTVRRQFEQLGRFFGVAEFAIHPLTLDREEKRRSLELVSHALELC